MPYMYSTVTQRNMFLSITMTKPLKKANTSIQWVHLESHILCSELSFLSIVFEVKGQSTAFLKAVSQLTPTINAVLHILHRKYSQKYHVHLSSYMEQARCVMINELLIQKSEVTLEAK
jgi:hypothetical protein